MKPRAFGYCRPDSLEEALDLLAGLGGDASVLAGGLSLGAMLNMRLASPGTVVDIGRVGGLGGVSGSGGTVTTGAMVRQADAMASPQVASGIPLLAEALPHVGHYQTRARGTLGGSVAHADPSAEIPLCLATLGGAVSLRSRSGARSVPAREFFQGTLATARRDDELVAALDWPRRGDGEGVAFAEMCRRRGDFAIVAVAASARVDGDRRVRALSVGFGGVEDRPFVADTAACAGMPATEGTARDVAEAAAGAVDPMADLHAGPDYRRQLVRVLGRRVVARAFERALDRAGGC